MTFGLDDVQKLKSEICADWVNELSLDIVEILDKSARFTWHAQGGILRIVNDAEKIVSGQATMAIADTASFMTICALNQKMCNCTTIDMHSNFMRPLFEGDIDITVTAIAMGRKTVTTRSDFAMAGETKLAATATGVFMYLS